MARMYCKKCPGSRGFNSWHTLRKHQWEAHREAYKRVGRSLKVSEVPVVKLLGPAEVAQLVSSEMTVTELLTKLRDQQSFLTDAINLIERISKR